MLDNYTGIISELSKISNSLSGITGTNYNALLYFEQMSGNVITDDVGNYVLDTIEEIKVQARLSQKKDPYLTINPGIDTIRTYLEGNLVCRLELNGAFPNFVKCELFQDNQWLSGKFSFINFIPHTVAENSSIAIATGQKICGYFEKDHNSL